MADEKTPAQRLAAASAYFVALGGRLQHLSLDVEKQERELVSLRAQVSSLEEALAEETMSAKRLGDIESDLHDFRRGILTREELFERWL